MSFVFTSSKLFSLFLLFQMVHKTMSGAKKQQPSKALAIPTKCITSSERDTPVTAGTSQLSVFIPDLATLTSSNEEDLDPAIFADYMVMQGVYSTFFVYTDLIWFFF